MNSYVSVRRTDESVNRVCGRLHVVGNDSLRMHSEKKTQYIHNGNVYIIIPRTH